MRCWCHLILPHTLQSILIYMSRVIISCSKMYVTFCASLQAVNTKVKNHAQVCLFVCCFVFVYVWGFLVVFVLFCIFFSFHFNYSTSFLTNNTANNQLLKWKHYLLSVLLIYFFRDSKLAMELNGGNPSYGTCKAIWHFKLLTKCLTGAADF